MSEVGAAQLWAGFNVFLTAQLFREAAGLATQIQGETMPTDKPGTLSMTVRQPAGVVLSMAPWNGAGVLAARAIAYPIVCGNTVVFRASETSPRTHAIIAEVLHEAGLPAGVLNFLTSTAEDSDRVVEAIIAHPAVRRVNFTGSTAGRPHHRREGGAPSQAGACSSWAARRRSSSSTTPTSTARSTRRCSARSSTRARSACPRSGSWSTRRSRTSSSRSSPRGPRPSPPAIRSRDAACVVGPMVRPESGDRINGLIDDAVAKGAEIVVGGHADGAAMPATIVDKVRPDMAIYDQETFGPITTVVRVSGVDEAVQVANDTEYGLAAAVFGADSTRALAGRAADPGRLTSTSTARPCRTRRRRPTAA